MEFSAQSIAELLGGLVDGDEDVKVTDISKIEEGKPGTLTFLANPKYTNFIYTTQASIVIVANDFKPEETLQSTLIRVKNPYRAFATLLDKIHNNHKFTPGISPNAFVDESAKIDSSSYIGPFTYVGKNAVVGKNVRIYPQAYIGDNASVGNDSIIYSGVKIFENCKVGKSCIIHGNSVLGSDGFGFVKNDDNKKVPQVGNVILEDYVEIGASVTIDRATLGSTIIRKGVKLDNLIQIAHNVEVGDYTMIASQTGISGSTKIGKNCLIGGQVGIVGHIQIADEVKIAAQSGISNHIKENGAVVQGSPAFKINDYQKSLVLFKNLPKLFKEVNDLRKQLNELRDNS
jgi:UDP-3-O-[3-hydroxymyristoyl] glucosamine N-acyltransferase